MVRAGVSRLAAAAALAAALAAGPARAQPIDAATLDSLLDEAVAGLPVRAVLAGVSTGADAPWLAARGESITGVAATPDMRFRNGAVAIAYLATVLLQQIDDGTLTLEDPLSTWFPDYPRADEVTLAMLIRGTSGYADYVPDPGFLKALHDDPFRAWTPEELIAIGLGQEMHCDPGSCWSYAHTNFVILGQVLAAATGRPVAVLIREGIIGPLGLTGTRSDQTATIPPPVLHAFDRERGIYEEATFWNPSWTLAEGAVMTSTIADLLCSGRALGQGTLVSAASHAEQMADDTARFPPWDAQHWYGMGLFVINGWVLQNPSFAGYAATMAHLPARDLSIAVSVTVTEEADPDHNYSTDILGAIAAALAPEHPLR